MDGTADHVDLKDVADSKIGTITKFVTAGGAVTAVSSTEVKDARPTSLVGRIPKVYVVPGVSSV